MTTVVIGAGVVGVACAYYLAADGHEVVVVERNDTVAAGTSYGNAGLVTPGDAYAWASPEALVLFLKSLVRPSMGIRVRLRPDPALWSWSWKFLRECTRERTRVNTLRKLRLAFYSRECLNTLAADTGISYDQRHAGVLYLFRSQQSLEAGQRRLGLLAEHGLRLDVLDRAGVTRLEPALAEGAQHLAGGLHSPMDQTGDSRRFSEALAAWCERERGVRFRYATTVTGFERSGSHISAVRTSAGSIAADTVVLAAGAQAPVLARSVGVNLPIYPVKGYSLTVPGATDAASPGRGGVDEDRLIAWSRLGDRMRIAAMAEFAGHDTSHQERDFSGMLAVARELFPAGGDYARAERWAGLRPMTPSSVPVFGRAGCDNLFLAAGHGHLGWTTACGSGRLVADLVAGRQPEIDTEGLLYGH